MANQLYAGIDLGGTNIKFGLVDRRANIVFHDSIKTKQTRKAIISQFIEIAEQLEKVARAREAEVFTLGIGSPGIVDVTIGKVVGGAPNVPQWRGTDMSTPIEKATGLEVYADNDANVMALAEHRYGAGRGYASGLYLTVGTGLGSGIILNNEIWRGAWYAGAEIGHTIIKYDGVDCQCGRRGCLEMYVNASSFWKYYGMRKAPEDGARVIFEKAKAGDKKAIAAIQKSAKHLAIGIGSMLNALNPEIVVIGGGVAGAGELYFKTIRQEVKNHCLTAASTGLRIVPAKLANYAGMIGAALLPLEIDRNKP